MSKTTNGREQSVSKIQQFVKTVLAMGDAVEHRASEHYSKLEKEKIKLKERTQVPVTLLTTSSLKKMTLQVKLSSKKAISTLKDTSS